MRWYLVALLTFLVPFPSYGEERWRSAFCETPVDLSSIQNVVGSDRLIMIGELHGTNEIPALVTALGCAYAKEGDRVLITLEMPAHQNTDIAAWLSGDAKAKERLLGNEFWSRKGDDRMSVAMFGIFEAVNILSDHLPIMVRGVDKGLSVSSGVIARDLIMARNLDAYLDSGEYDRVIMLVGNAHSRLVPTEGFVAPISSHIKNSDIYSLNVSFKQGEIWACMRNCGVQPLDFNKDDKRASNIVHPSDKPDYDGILLLDRVTASPPMVQQ